MSTEKNKEILAETETEKPTVEPDEKVTEKAAEKKEKTAKKKGIRKKVHLAIIVFIELLAVVLVIALIFFADKKMYTVTFDLDGGILLSGDAEQRVVQGQSATPPKVAKYGHYLRGWSGSYKSITQNVVIKAIWEYETTPGIEYSVPANTNYCSISGSFKEIQGEVYIGAYYAERQVLGINSGAFKDRTGITGVYLLDGILTIDSEAFSGCTSLEVIEIPSTVVRIGASAFKNCKNLKEIVLPASLEIIEASAFEGCTSLEKVTFENGIKTIGKKAFYGCENLLYVYLPGTVRVIGKSAFNTPEMTIELYIKEDQTPRGFFDGWFEESAIVVYEIGDRDPVIEEYIIKEEEEDDGVFFPAIKDPSIIRPGVDLPFKDPTEFPGFEFLPEIEIKPTPDWDEDSSKESSNEDDILDDFFGEDGRKDPFEGVFREPIKDSSEEDEGDAE